MTELKKAELLNSMDELWANFLHVRASYPHVNLDHLGQSSISSPHYYNNKGLNFTIKFEQALTEEDIERLTNVSHWINQSVIIRLVALLEYHQVISSSIKINKEIDGHEEVEIARFLRNHFAHTDNKADSGKKWLFDMVVNHFNLKVDDSNQIPIDINTVIEPIFCKVKEYIEQFTIQIKTMRDKSRIPEMLKLIEEIWKENPDFRLGQLIVAAIKPTEPCPQVFSLEDDKMKEKLEALMSTMRAARQSKS